MLARISEFWRVSLSVSEGLISQVKKFLEFSLLDWTLPLELNDAHRLNMAHTKNISISIFIDCWQPYVH